MNPPDRQASPAAPRVLVISEVAERDSRGLEPFRRAGFELVERYDLNGCDDERALGEALKGIWGTLAGTERYTRAVLASCPDLRVIARCGVGYDRVDVVAASDLGVAVLTTPGANVEAVADFTLMLILGGLERVHPAVGVPGAGVRWPQTGGRSLTRSTVGIVGLGAIGLAVAARLSGFGCRLLGIDPAAKAAECEQLGIERMSLSAALPKLDVLTLHLPLTPETRGIIGATELSRLPAGALVVNTARGGLLDEQALLAELETGRLWGAGLDVFANEPLPTSHPLASASRTIFGGHVASFTERSVEATLDKALNGLRALADGRLPESCVNAPAWLLDSVGPGVG